jgi:hypothetical protein
MEKVIVLLSSAKQWEKKHEVAMFGWPTLSVCSNFKSRKYSRQLNFNRLNPNKMLETEIVL